MLLMCTIHFVAKDLIHCIFITRSTPSYPDHHTVPFEAYGFQIPIQLKHLKKLDFYYSVDIRGIKSGIFDSKSIGIIGLFSLCAISFSSL